MWSSLSDELVWDKDKGELRILGRRQLAITPQDLCNYLDSLVGVPVSDVIINNLEFRGGKQETELFRKERPNSSVRDLIDVLIKYDSLTGVGITTVTLPEQQDKPILLEIFNPCVKGTIGAAKSFLFSWWCGALSALLGKDFEARNAAYDEKSNAMRCEILPRPKD
jgi:hypothetical protein